MTDVYKSLIGELSLYMIFIFQNLNRETDITHKVNFSKIFYNAAIITGLQCIGEINSKSLFYLFLNLRE